MPAFVQERLDLRPGDRAAGDARLAWSGDPFVAEPADLVLPAEFAACDEPSAWAAGVSAVSLFSG
jgi:hypothetical protein